jgi:reactive intermediate/imine deaminase
MSTLHAAPLTHSLAHTLPSHTIPPNPAVNANLPPPQSQAIIAGPQIFVSGQIPADTKGNLIDGSIADKTTQCCENIKGILTEAGVKMDRVVKVNVFLDDMAHFAEMNGVFEKYFAHKPARSCVAVKQLPKGVPVEIECIAYTGEFRREKL